MRLFLFNGPLSRGGHFVSGDLQSLFMHDKSRRENEASRA